METDFGFPIRSCCYSIKWLTTYSNQVEYVQLLHYEQIWRMLEVLLHRLHLLISHDCPLAIRHKKGEIVDCILEFLICILFILALMHFFLYGLYMLGGDIMFMCLLSVSRINRLIQSWLLSSLATNRQWFRFNGNQGFLIEWDVLL